MSNNDAEKLKLAEYYSDKVSNLHRSIGFLQDQIDATRDPNKKRQLIYKSTNAYRSKLPGLYTNLKKNAESVIKLGTRIFPEIKSVFDEPNDRYEFLNCPNMTKLIKEYEPTLSKLATTSTTMKSPDGKKTPRQSTPCFSTNIKGAQPELSKLSEFMRKTKHPSSDLREFRLLDLSVPDGITQCEQDHCLDCVDCAPHQEELRKALLGIISEEPETGDSMRNLHMKNLITTLGSWAAHLDTRGRSKETSSDAWYSDDAQGHHILASNMRVMAHRLNIAYEDDHKLKPGMGGGIHRDNFGIGDNPRVY